MWNLNTDQLVECPGATGGAILNRSLGSYPGIAAFQPVINGVAGNLGAVPAFQIIIDKKMMKICIPIKNDTDPDLADFGKRVS